MGIFSDFEYSFRSSRSNADFLKVVSDRIARAFNSSAATLAAALISFHQFNNTGDID